MTVCSCFSFVRAQHFYARFPNLYISHALCVMFGFARAVQPARISTCSVRVLICVMLLLCACGSSWSACNCYSTAHNRSRCAWDECVSLAVISCSSLSACLLRQRDRPQFHEHRTVCRHRKLSTVTALPVLPLSASLKTKSRESFVHSHNGYAFMVTLCLWILQTGLRLCRHVFFFAITNSSEFRNDRAQRNMKNSCYLPWNNTSDTFLFRQFFGCIGIVAASILLISLQQAQSSDQLKLNNLQIYD